MAMTPQQMGAAGMWLQLGGMASGAIGSFYAAKAQKSALEFQAAMAKINARIAETSAQGEMLRGERAVGQLTMRAGRLKSAQRARLAANGVDLGAGNAAELLASTEIMKEIDANTMNADTVARAGAMRMQAVNSANDSLLARATASGISPLGSAAGSLLGSAGSVAQSWYTLKKDGALAGSVFDF